MKPFRATPSVNLVSLALACALLPATHTAVGVGAKPLPGAEVLFDGSH